MEQVSQPRARASAWVVPACLAAIVLGILGMHALNHDAVMTAEPGHSMSLPAPTAAMSLAAAGGTQAVVPSVAGAEHAMGHVMMLCGAMLLGVALGLLVARGSRGFPTRWPAGRLRQLVSAVRPQRGSTGPPYVWDFSVIRC